MNKPKDYNFWESCGIFFGNRFSGIHWMYASKSWHDLGSRCFFADCFWHG